MIKKDMVLKDLEVLKKEIFRLYKNKKYEKVLSAISAYANVVYETNVFYSDDEIEEVLKKIAKDINRDHKKNKTINNNGVVFFDSFGKDLRGLALIYIKAFINIKVDFIYVTYKKFEKDIPTIKKVINSSENSKIIYLDNNTNINTIYELDDILSKSKFGNLFVYTYPNDVVGFMVSAMNKENVKSYLINLTDHAFWIGKSIYNFYIDFRDYGANISIQKRGINKEKIIKLPYYPYIDKNIKFQGFPNEKFNKNNVIFSGGSIYKTLGEGNLYYKNIEEILKRHNNIMFWYAGEGDRSELNKLIKMFPERVCVTEERKDLFQVLCNCKLYLNTYPIIGGLMTQYAAAASVIPVTLSHDECSRELLFNEDELGIEFSNSEDMLVEIDKLIDDKDYYRMKIEKISNNRIIAESDFEKNLKMIIFEQKSSYKIKTYKIDTRKFQNIYLDRIDIFKYSRSLINRKSLILGRVFIGKFIISMFDRVREVMKKLLFNT